jgi:hypothetical protein
MSQASLSTARVEHTIYRNCGDLRLVGLAENRLLRVFFHRQLHAPARFLRGAGGRDQQTSKRGEPDRGRSRS